MDIYQIFCTFFLNFRDFDWQPSFRIFTINLPYGLHQITVNRCVPFGLDLSQWSQHLTEYSLTGFRNKCVVKFSGRLAYFRRYFYSICYINGSKKLKASTYIIASYTWSATSTGFEFITYQLCVACDRVTSIKLCLVRFTIFCLDLLPANRR